MNEPIIKKVVEDWFTNEKMDKELIKKIVRKRYYENI